MADLRWLGLVCVAALVPVQVSAKGSRGASHEPRTRDASGPLSQTVGGIARQSSISSEGSREGGDSDSDSGGDDDGWVVDDDDRDDQAVSPPARVSAKAEELSWVTDGSVHLDTWYTAIRGSGGAAGVQVAARLAMLQLAAGHSYFFEPTRSGVVSMNMSRLGLDLLFGANMQIEFGVGGALVVTELDMLTGMYFHLSAEKALAPGWAARVGARGYLLGEIAVGEAFANLRWGVIRAGYRVTDFTVGPPLHGPELGVSVSF